MGFRFRRFLGIGAVSVTAALSASSAWAQQPPNDNELRAAYCIGHVQIALKLIATVRADVAKEPGSPNAESLLSKLVKEDQEQNDRLARLQGYLLPKLNRLDSVAVTFAIQRGQSDYDRWKNELFACVHECPMKDFRDAESCTKKCGETELNQRAQQCRNLSWLPF